MSKPEIYVSTDVEADGPIPGPHSMLSFGSAAFNEEGKMVDTFSANLHTLPGATMHPDTKKFWDKNAAAYLKSRENLLPPEFAIPAFIRWVKKLPGIPVFVGYPVAYDFMWVYWYLMKYAGESPFSHSGLDIKTLAMIALGNGYRGSTKKAMPKEWFPKDLKHTHVGLDDAIEQGHVFVNALKQLRKMKKALECVHSHVEVKLLRDLKHHGDDSEVWLTSSGCIGNVAEALNRR